MKEQYIKVFCCEYCGKTYRVKSTALRHEVSCRYNPSRRALCYGCANYTPADFTEPIRYSTDSPLGEVESVREMNPHECFVKGRKLYNNVRQEGLLAELHEQNWEQMPTEKRGCLYYEQMKRRDYGRNYDWHINERVV